MPRFIADNQDNYPHMGPIKAFYITWKETIYFVTMLSNSTISDFAFNRSLGQISFNVTGTQGTAGFCKVTIPRELLDGAFKVQVNDTLIGFILTKGSTHTFVYFTYTHTTHEVRITGEIARIQGDLDGDGDVDINDLYKLGKNFGKTEGP